MSWALSCVGCATGGGSASSSASSSPSLGSSDAEDAIASPLPAATTYDTAPRAGGVLGGPQAIQIADAVAEALRKRGDQAEPDGALAASGRRLARDLQEGRKVGMSAIEAAGRRLGFAGVILWALIYTIEGDDSGAWREGLAQIAHNLPITRYGVSVAPGGRVVAVIFGSVEATLEPFPRQLSPGATLSLNGEVASRFTFAHVYLTGSDGRVQETRMPARRIAASLKLPWAGVYTVEILGDGATGPVVVVNVPVYVGVSEPASSLVVENGGAGASGSGAPSAGGGAATVAGAGGGGAAPGDAAVWPARALDLLNRARAQDHLGPLRPDAELAGVALGHCQDMAANGFFGHQSPTTGGPEDRVRRAGAVVSIVGENVAEADTAETAHQLLMGSPAHRSNMLGAKFTHVGIGVARLGQHGIFVTTLVFGRRPTIPPAQLTVDDVTKAIAALRAAAGVAPLEIAPALQAAAGAGIQAYAAAPAGSVPTRQAFEASERALKNEVRQRGKSIAACAKLIELLEPEEDLTQSAQLVSPALRRIGVAVTPRNDPKAPRLVVLLMLEGTGCH